MGIYMLMVTLIMMMKIWMMILICLTRYIQCLQIHGHLHAPLHADDYDDDNENDDDDMDDDDPHNILLT